MLDVIQPRPRRRIFEEGPCPPERVSQGACLGARRGVLERLRESSGMPFEGIDSREERRAAVKVRHPAQAEASGLPCCPRRTSRPERRIPFGLCGRSDVALAAASLRAERERVQSWRSSQFTRRFWMSGVSPRRQTSSIAPMMRSCSSWPGELVLADVHLLARPVKQPLLFIARQPAVPRPSSLAHADAKPGRLAGRRSRTACGADGAPDPSHDPRTAVLSAERCFGGGDDVPRVQKASAAGGDHHRRWLGGRRPNRLGRRISGPICHDSSHLAFDHAVAAPHAGALRRATSRASRATHARRRP